MVRAIIAFVVSPPIPVLLFKLPYLFIDGPRPELSLAALSPALYAYPAAMMLGIPLYLFARRRNWLRWWQIILFACLVGVIAAMLVFTLVTAFFSVAGGRAVPMSSDTIAVLTAMAWSGLWQGALSGIAFAFIVCAHMGSNRAPHRDGREAAHFGQSPSAPARGRER